MIEVGDNLVAVAWVDGDDRTHVDAGCPAYEDLPGACSLEDKMRSCGLSVTWCGLTHAHTALVDASEVDCGDCAAGFTAAMLVGHGD